MEDIVEVVIGNVLRAGGSVLVVDDLTSTSATAALSAKQGKVLSDMIESVEAGGDAPVQSVAGKIGAVTLTKVDVGLTNVDNTSDANKPVSTAQASAISSKEPTVAIGTTGQYYRGDKTFQTLDKTAVGLSNVDNTADSAKPVSAAQQTAFNSKEGTITAGTTGQYWRGDKSFQTLDKAAVGLANVDNTTDANKPVSSATQTAINLKADSSALAPVATSGAYSSLTGKPALATVATSGIYADLTNKPQIVVQSTMPSDISGYPDGTMFIIG